MKAEIREVLEFFVEKADELMASDFVRRLNETGKTGFRVSVNRVEDGKWLLITDRSGPTRTEVKAFAVTFRFFIQDTDKISFRSLSKLCSDESLSEHWRTEFRRVRYEVNDYLDNRHLPIAVDGAPNPSMREIMNVFIYGDITHGNGKHRPTYIKWRESGFFLAFENEFVVLMSNILGDITYVAELCRRELQPVSSR